MTFLKMTQNRKECSLCQVTVKDSIWSISREGCNWPINQRFWLVQTCMLIAVVLFGRFNMGTCRSGSHTVPVLGKHTDPKMRCATKPAVSEYLWVVQYQPPYTLQSACRQLIVHRTLRDVGVHLREGGLLSPSFPPLSFIPLSLFYPSQYMNHSFDQHHGGVRQNEAGGLASPSLPVHAQPPPPAGPWFACASPLTPGSCLPPSLPLAPWFVHVCPSSASFFVHVVCPLSSRWLPSLCSPSLLSMAPLLTAAAHLSITPPRTGHAHW